MRRHVRYFNFDFNSAPAVFTGSTDIQGFNDDALSSSLFVEPRGLSFTSSGVG